jgi:hypothetical protein
MAIRILQRLFIIGPGFITYVIFRIVSYRITNPRPYLWWHVLVDLGAMTILLVYAWLIRGI